MMVSCFLFLCSLQSFTDNGPGKLVFLDAYNQPNGTVHIIVRNESDGTLALHPREIRHLADSMPLPVWWLHAIPENLAPGSLGQIAFSMKRPNDLRGGHQIVFDEGIFECALNVNASGTPLTVAHMVLDRDHEDVFVFLQNHENAASEISAMEINGIPLEIAPECKNRPVPPQGSAMIYAPRPTGLNTFRLADPFVVHIDTPGASMYRHAFLFRGPIFTLGNEESETTVFQCPTHEHGPWNKAADALFSHASGNTSGIPTVHFCRNRFVEGLTAFGQCLPRVLVNLQSSDLERGKPVAWDALGSTVRTVCNAVQPGVFVAILEPNSILEGDYVHPPEKTAPIIPARELKHLAYMAVANGAKGILFRMGDNPSPEFKAMADVLTRDLSRIVPLLGVSGPFTLSTTLSAPSVSANALSCGRDAFLVVLTSSDLTQENPAGLTLSITLPAGFSPKHWMEIGDSWKSVTLTPPSSTLTIVLENFKDNALLLIDR